MASRGGFLSLTQDCSVFGLRGRRPSLTQDCSVFCLTGRLTALTQDCSVSRRVMNSLIDFSNELLVFCEQKSESFESLMLLYFKEIKSDLLSHSFVMSDRSELLTVTLLLRVTRALFYRATIANGSQSLNNMSDFEQKGEEQKERIPNPSLRRRLPALTHDCTVFDLRSRLHALTQDCYVFCLRRSLHALTQDCSVFGLRGRLL